MINPLRSQLDPIARNNQRWQLWRALAVCWAALAVLGLLFRASLPPHHSPAAFSALIALAVFAAGIILYYFRRTPPDYLALARQIEGENPELHALLLTAVEQSPASPDGELNYLQQRVVAEALAHARQSPWGQRNAQRLGVARGAHWLCFLIFVAVLAAIRPMAPRANDMWADVKSSSGVAVSPGDTNLERGSGLVILARFEGKLPAEATLVVQAPNENERRVVLGKLLADPVFGGAVPEVKTDLKYHVEYSGERTRDFKVTVFEYPKLDHADARITYPAYTSLPEKTIKDTRRVSAVEGSTLDYSFFLNKRVASAKLVGRDNSVIALATDTNNATIYHLHLVLQQSLRAQLLLVDDAGRTNRMPPEFVIDALKNQPAIVKLVTPRGDVRVSAIEEIPFQAEVSDDFGLHSYGIAYQLGDGETKTVELGKNSGPHEKKQMSYLLPLENLGAQPDQLLSYYAWADDLGADGTVRRTTSDLFFAEVRPFDQIFREGQAQDPNAANAQNNNQGGGQGQGGGSPAEKLTDLQKQVMSATWNLKRRETAAKPTAPFKDDAIVVRDAQAKALDQARTMSGNLTDARLKGYADAAVKAMEKAAADLGEAADKNTATPLTTALTQEQSAYQSLLRLQAREYQVARGNRNQRQQQRGGGNSQRSQDQVDQLDLKQTQNRYETQREASAAQTPEQRENLQVANRLKELAQRQQDLNGKLKELQTALQEAKTEAQRDEIRDQLKRLRDEQQDLLAGVDELRQRMDNAQNQSAMSEERQQLDKTRADVQRAAEALNQEQVPKALTSGTRAERELQQLQNDVRKKNSSEFAEQMRQMRDTARQMAQKEEDIAKKLADVGDPAHKSLSDADERHDLATQLARQENTVSNLFTNMKQISEQSETAEPLLSKELYDILRKSRPEDINQALDFSSQTVQRGFVSEASKAEKTAQEQINNLKQGVEHAAETVLGDDTEALRLARKELQDLTEQLNQELAQAGNGQGTNASGRSPNGAEGQPGSGQRSGANSNAVQQAAAGQRGGQQASPGQRGDQQAASGQRSGEGQQPGQNGQGQGSQAGQRGGQQAASGQRGGQRAGQGQPGQRGGGNQDSPDAGQQDQQAQEAQASDQQGQQPGNQGAGQNGQRGQRGQGRGQGQGQGQDEQQAASGGQPGEQTAQNQGGGRNGARAGARDNAGRGGAVAAGGYRDFAGGGSYAGGPLSGTNFVDWSDRLRNVEEMVNTPDLQTEVAQIRDRARVIRQQYLRTGARPDWAVVKTQIAAPLAEVRVRVDEELARRASKEALVPLDRDPVPVQFTERVKRYYEELGKNE